MSKLPFLLGLICAFTVSTLATNHHEHCIIGSGPGGECTAERPHRSSQLHKLCQLYFTILLCYVRSLANVTGIRSAPAHQCLGGGLEFLVWQSLMSKIIIVSVIVYSHS